MPDKCKNCGCTASQAIADAKTLGLQRELENGVYTCCQIADWAQEQWTAWMEATQQDSERADQVQDPVGDEVESVFVPVRFRKPVPWRRQ